jgi:hypothetical protein
MAGRGQRKCKGCQRLFRPDVRNRRHQRYCSEEPCRAASKTASQARWLSQPENQDYFRGEAAVDRVRAWRCQNPGYWRKPPRSASPLQDALTEQGIESTDKKGDSTRPPLQEVLSAQPAVLIGLIAHIAGTPLQEDITVAAGRLLRLGNEILATSDSQVPVASRATSGSRGPPGLTARGGCDRLRDFCKIHDCHDRQGLTIAQTARFLGLDARTVATWIARPHFTPRRSRPRQSLLDPFKPTVTRLLDTHPYSAQQIFQRLREQGYQGGITIVRDYVRRIRPTKLPVYLKLAFAAGECAQVDWGSHGTITIDDTRRRLGDVGSARVLGTDMFDRFV